MKRVHSKNSIFLMEIILNILLFSALLVVGLQLFMRAHKLTEKTMQLHQAVACCENAAAVFESGNGTLNDLLAAYRYSANLDHHVLIYLDENFNECRKKDASYYISAALTEDSESRLSKLTLTCYTVSSTPIYTLTACHYTQLQAAYRDCSTKEVAS